MPPPDLAAAIGVAAMAVQQDPQPPALRRLATDLARVGANLTVLVPDLAPIPIGERPEATRVTFHSREALEPLLSGNHLQLAEAYLDGRIDITGDLTEVMKLTDLLDMDVGRLRQAAFWLRLHLPDRARYQRAGIAFHYDRPPEFFLGWFDRWRSYSHGFYRTAHDPATEAQARKMQFAIDALGLEPGMDVFDMGCGWGCFIEYAGRQGIRVHGITISQAQHAFVTTLIRTQNLPCTVELIDFLHFRPGLRFDGAVFMGTLEHMPTYERVTGFLDRYLKPHGRMYTDFCAQRSSFLSGGFMRKYVWPGSATYVNLRKLVDTLVLAGFNIYELQDDTRSYAYTVRDWAAALERIRGPLAGEFGEPSVRAFLLFLHGSYHFLMTNRTQAYHLVAGRLPAPLRAK